MRDNSLVFRAAADNVEVVEEQIALLTSTTATESQKEEAVGLLWIMSSFDENKTKIAFNGGIPPLIELVKAGTSGQKYRAMSVLKNLAQNVYFGMMIGNNGGIPPLIDLLLSSEDRHKERASMVLWNLSSSDTDYYYLDEIAKGIRPLIALLTGTYTQKIHAMGILTDLSHHSTDDNDYDSEIVNNGGIPPLINLLLVGTEIEKNRALGLIWTLTGGDGPPNDMPLKSVADSNGIPLLIGILTYDTYVSNDTLYYGISILRRLAVKNKITIVQDHTDMIEILIALLSTTETEPRIRREAATMLEKLSQLYDHVDSRSKRAADMLSQTLGDAMTTQALEELFKMLWPRSTDTDDLLALLRRLSEIQNIRSHFHIIFHKRIIGDLNGKTILDRLWHMNEDENIDDIVENISIRPDSPPHKPPHKRQRDGV